MKKIIIILLLTLNFANAQVLPSLFDNGVETPFTLYLTLTTTERNALSYDSDDRVLIFNETTDKFEYWDGDSWEVFEGGSNGNFIPLSGTEVGSPVTGDIIFGRGYIGNGFSGDGEDSSIALVSENTTAGFWFNEISDPRPEMVYGLTDGGVEDYYSTFGLSRYQATLRGDDINYRGLVYSADYSANYVDRSLIDKAYLESYVASNSPSLNQEEVEDIVGGMVASSPQEGILVEYDDVNGELQFTVNATANEIGYDNSGSTLTATNVDNALDELDAKIPSNSLNYVTVTDSIYTLQEADILAYKPHIIETYRADGTTQADTVTITYPRDITPPTNEMLAVTFTNVSGSAIKVVPDSTVVIDRRTKTQQQYVLPKDYLGSASLFSVSQDTIWANGADWVISDYTQPSVPSVNYVLNGTFDTSDDLTTGTSWSIGSGVASYDALTDNDELNLDLTPLTNGTTYEMTFEVVSGTLRLDFRAFDAGDSAQSIATYSNYTPDTYTITWTATQDTDRFRIRGLSSSGGTSGTLDNVIITEQ